jgi:hypothetical protein
MLKYTLEEKKLPSSSYCCEVCGKKPAKAGVKEFTKMVLSKYIIVVQTIL